MAITLNTKTYNYIGNAAAISTYQERSGGLIASFSNLTASVKIGTRVSTLWKLSVPVVAATDTSCACAGTVLRKGDVDINVRLDPTMTDAERLDLALRVKDLVASTAFQASITGPTVPTS